MIDVFLRRFAGLLFQVGFVTSIAAQNVNDSAYHQAFEQRRTWLIAQFEKLSNYRFRNHESQNGYVVEVRNKAEIGSFEKFCAALKKGKASAVLEQGKISAAYKNLDGVEMEFSFPDARIINGKTYSLETGKLFDGPFLNADADSEKLRLG